MDILKFLEHNTIDDNFDEVFYEQQCPSLIDFYEPFASQMGITKKQKYFFHYKMYGKDLNLLPADQPIDHGVSLVIACKNREENLQQIIPSWHDVEFVKEIIVVDYFSDNALEFKDYQKVKVIRVENEPFFNLGKAYNIGFDFASCEFIMKIDSDYLLLNDAFLTRFFRNPNAKKYFIRADYAFSRNTSGFFLIHQSYNTYFREDLNGYGYDEIDLYNRIRLKHPNIKEIILFDIDEYIFHIPHNHEERSNNYANKDVNKSEENNRNMCELYSPYVPARLNYTVKNKNIYYDKQSIDRIFCINLSDRTDRWNNIKNKNLLERFPAIDTRAGESKIDKFGLKINPCNLSAKAYLNHCQGSIGVYLSHYAIWQKIIADKIPIAVILEDDIESDAVIKILNSNIITNNFELINLSKRITWDKKKEEFFFDGAESYIITLEGARKLVTATHFPILLSNIIPQSYHSLNSIEDTNFNHSHSIVTAVDKFIGYCCEKNADQRIRLNHYIYPIIDLNETYISDIDKEGTKVWDMNEQEIRKIINEN